MSVLFGDTVTLYHNGSKTVLVGVQWHQKIVRTVDGTGRNTAETVTTVTLPTNQGFADVSAVKGDVLVLGTGPDITALYTLADLRREWPTYCTVRAVTDNTLRPRLKHRRIEAV